MLQFCYYIKVTKHFAKRATISHLTKSTTWVHEYSRQMVYNCCTTAKSANNSESVNTSKCIHEEMILQDINTNVRFI
jgi:hypothetical protein